MVDQLHGYASGMISGGLHANKLIFNVFELYALPVVFMDEVRVG